MKVRTILTAEILELERQIALKKQQKLELSEAAIPHQENVQLLPYYKIAEERKRFASEFDKVESRMRELRVQESAYDGQKAVLDGSCCLTPAHRDELQVAEAEQSRKRQLLQEAYDAHASRIATTTQHAEALAHFVSETAAARQLRQEMVRPH